MGTTTHMIILKIKRHQAMSTINDDQFNATTFFFLFSFEKRLADAKMKDQNFQVTGNM